MSPALKLAVIVATKNRSQLLATRSLASVKNQTLTPDFLIVCDDSDDSHIEKNRAIVDQLKLNKCETIYLRNHRTPGASGCWNSAIDNLLTKVDFPEHVYIAILDDDDEWDSSYLETCINAVEKQNLDMVACGINRIEDAPNNSIKRLAPDKLSVCSFLVGNPGIQGSNLFLRLATFLQAGCFDEALTSSTDRDLCIRLAELNTILYQPIQQILVQHYAESNRGRLSTPGSNAKRAGLDAFWEKHGGRMTKEQQDAFLARAKTLFNWHKPSEKQSLCDSSSDNKAIVLALCSQLNDIFLEKLLEIFHHFRQHHLVGLDIVFRAQDEPKHQKFSEILRDHGIGCFPVPPKFCLREYSVQVASFRASAEIYYIESLSDESFKESHQITDYLSTCKIKILQNQKPLQADVQRIKETIYQERLISAKHCITQHLQVKNLKVLGSGSEAIVFSDGQTVYKCIDYWKPHSSKAQFEFLRDNGPLWKNTQGLYPLHSVTRFGTWVLITYPFEDSVAYQGGHEDQLIGLINGCTKAGIVCNNICPKNLIIATNEVKLIDYGSDIRPWNALGFEHMAKRAYLSCWHAEKDNLSDLMRQCLTNPSLTELDGFEQFRAKLDYPINKPSFLTTDIESAPTHLPFELIIGVISADPLALMPLLNSLRVLKGHPGIKSLSVMVLCNGCAPSEITTLITPEIQQWLTLEIIPEKKQHKDALTGYFGADIHNRPNGQVGIALARTMLQRYLSVKMEHSPGSIGWILDDDMRLDQRAHTYISWLPAFREQGVDVLFGAYEGASPNPPLNGLRVQLMDLAHNLSWLSHLKEDELLPNRSQENDERREQFSDYYYDLSRKHTAHLESPLWVEPSYAYETVKQARARLISGALGILNGTPLTRSIIAPKCKNPLIEAKDSVNRGGCTFILNHESILRTPNLIPSLNQKEARRSDMIWAIVNRYYRGLSIKAVAFPVYHVGRSTPSPTLNADKVKGEIIGSALYAGLTDFLSENPKHRLNFTLNEKALIFQKSMRYMESRLVSLKKSFYRISGLAEVLDNSDFHDELIPLITCIKKEFSVNAFDDIAQATKGLSQSDIFNFLDKITKSTDAYNDANKNNLVKSTNRKSQGSLNEIKVR